MKSIGKKIYDEFWANKTRQKPWRAVWIGVFPGERPQLLTEFVRTNY